MFYSVLVVGFAGAMIHGEVFEPVPVGMENIAFGIYIIGIGVSDGEDPANPEMTLVISKIGNLPGDT